MKIEKGIPVPTNTSDVFKEMEVGDSVFIAGGSNTCKEFYRAKKYFQRNGKKMRSRTVDGGIRLWRIA